MKLPFLSRSTQEAVAPVNPLATDPPFVPLTYFLDTFSQAGKRLFWGLLALLLLALGGVLWAHYNPTTAVMRVEAIADATPVEVPVGGATHDWLEVPQQAVAHKAFVNYATTPIEVNSWLVLAMLGLLAAGWAAVLAASSRMAGVVGFLPYLAFAAWLMFSAVPDLLLGETPFRLGALAVIMVFLLPAFAFKQKYLVWGQPAQWGLFLLMLLGLFAIVYKVEGLAGLHQVATFPSLMMGLLTLGFLLVVSRELVNLLAALAFLHRDPSRRQPLWVFLIMALLLLLGEGFVLAQHLHVLPPSGWLQPVHFFVAAAAVAVFTMQNVYRSVSATFQTHLSFALGLLGLALLSAATVFYYYASAEYMFRAQFQRNLMLYFTTVHFLYLLYLLLHFAPYINKRFNIYFGLAKPPRPSNISLTTVWFLALFLFLFLEGTGEGSYSLRLLRVVQENQLADNEILRDRPVSALARYNQALLTSRRDPKANYNAAGIMLSQNASIVDVVPYYREAEAFVPFPAARITHANLLRARSQPFMALQALQEGLEERLDPHVLANLAALYRYYDKPDNAVGALKKAILLAPDNAALYANMAMVYQENNRPDYARDLYAAALDVDPHDPWALAGAAWYELTNPAPKSLLPEVPQALLTDTLSPTSFRNNLALLALRRGDFAQADALAASLNTEEYELPEALIIRLIAKARQDSFDNAVSRYAYLADSYGGAYKALAAHNLGVAYHGAGVPEVAADYFAVAGENGRWRDSVYLAQMVALQGAHEPAARLLSQLRVWHPDFYAEGGREVAMLLRANDQNDLAQLDWDFREVTLPQYLRIAAYADQANQTAIAIEMLGLVAGIDSTTTQPYILAGEMLIARGEYTEAYNNLTEGQKRNPADAEVQALRALALLKQNKTAEAGQLLDPLLAGAAAQNTTVRRVHAERLALTGKLDAAIQTLTELHTRQILDTDITLRLGQLLLQKKDPTTVVRLAAEVMALNRRNSQLWAMYARAEQQLENVTAAGYAAREARKYALTSTTQKAIDQEFAAVLPYGSDYSPTF